MIIQKMKKIQGILIIPNPTLCDGLTKIISDLNSNLEDNLESREYSTQSGSSEETDCWCTLCKCFSFFAENWKQNISGYRYERTFGSE